MRREISGRIKNLIIKEMKPYGLDPIGIGGAERHGMITGIELVFDTERLLDIKTAREILIDGAEKAIQIASTQEESREFFEEVPVPLKLFRISILGPTVPSGDSVHIQAARVTMGNLYYDVINPDPRWDNYVHVHEETFEEARAIVNGSG
ncbi:MAG: hypothetical protein H7A36_04270 [Chlamydiales bacterium]|nr:hypothetical protein [Chlamydiales bacterium]